jgi:hypothetical protein
VTFTFGDHVVTVLRAPEGSDNPYGNQDRDWDAATEIQVTGCSVQPVQGDEVTVGRDTVVSRWRFYAPDGTDILASDRVRFEGDVYEVDGEVQRWDFPPLSHVTALLRRGY